MPHGFLAQAGAPSAPSGFGAILGNPLFVLLAFFIIMYFLLIRPKQKEQREHQKMLAALERGDRIITTGGIYGLIEQVREKEGILVVKVAEKVKIELSRSAVLRVLERGGPVDTE